MVAYWHDRSEENVPIGVGWEDKGTSSKFLFQQNLYGDSDAQISLEKGKKSK